MVDYTPKQKPINGIMIVAGLIALVTTIAVGQKFACENLIKLRYISEHVRLSFGYIIEEMTRVL